MTYQERYLTASVLHDLDKKMVFLGGPRQVGKTTLSKYTSRKCEARANPATLSNFQIDGKVKCLTWHAIALFQARHAH